MRFFKGKKGKDLVTIEIVYRKPLFPKGFKFVKKYQVKDDPQLDVKNILRDSFHEANPDWEILNIKVSREE